MGITSNVGMVITSNVGMVITSNVGMVITSNVGMVITRNVDSSHTHVDKYGAYSPYHFCTVFNIRSTGNRQYNEVILRTRIKYTPLANVYAIFSFISMLIILWGTC